MTVIYKAKEVMDQLDLKDSVFKKYIGLLEREGYVIERNAQGHRLFKVEDIKTLETFMELSKYDGMTLESVAKKIGSMKTSEGHEGITDNENNRHDVMSLVEMAVSDALAKQEERFAQANKQLADEMKREIKALGERLEKSRVEELRLALETQKQLAATQEKLETERKKGIWTKLFGR
jgi:DNA-binding transcriptional MerR regulator